MECEMCGNLTSNEHETICLSCEYEMKLIKRDMRKDSRRKKLRTRIRDNYYDFSDVAY